MLLSYWRHKRRAKDRSPRSLNLKVRKASLIFCTNTSHEVVPISCYSFHVRGPQDTLPAWVLRWLLIAPCPCRSRSNPGSDTLKRDLLSIMGGISMNFVRSVRIPCQNCCLERSILCTSGSQRLGMTYKKKSYSLEVPARLAPNDGMALRTECWWLRSKILIS